MKRLRLVSQTKRAFQGSSRGMTLIEVLIAVALMGMIAMAVLSALSTASLALFTANKRATAESLARSQLEYVKNQNYGQTYDKIAPIPDGYSICSVNGTGAVVEAIVGIPWDSEQNEPAEKDDGLQKIKLVIKHDNKEVLTLEGYKRKPEKEPGG